MMTNHELRYSKTAVNNVRKAVENMACKCDPHEGGGGGGDTALCALSIGAGVALTRVSAEFLDTFVLNEYSDVADFTLYDKGALYYGDSILFAEAYGAFYKDFFQQDNPSNDKYDLTDVTISGISIDDISEVYIGVMTKYNLVLKSFEHDTDNNRQIYYLSGTIEIIRGATLDK